MIRPSPSCARRQSWLMPSKSARPREAAPNRSGCCSVGSPSFSVGAGGASWLVGVRMPEPHPEARICPANTGSVPQRGASQFWQPGVRILVERYGLKWHEEDETVGNGFTGTSPRIHPAESLVITQILLAHASTFLL